MDYESLYNQYQTEGCLKIENFLTLGEVAKLKAGVEDVVDNMGDENSYAFTVYGAGKKNEADEYFISAGDKIRYFFEIEAFDSEGKLLIDKKDALNKVGYGMHWLHPTFRNHNFSQKIKDLLRNFHYKDPVITQSMIIFKKPKIGEIVRPHQDSTFLYTDPPTCIGLWFPLEDATLENGCLWYIPGSHKGEIHQRFIRNPNKDQMLIMEGEIPEYSDDQYVAVPAKKGDCVIIHGTVVHRSGPNTTQTPRTVYTYHLVEKEALWSPKNWVQPTEFMPFPSLYDY